jgi:hypothetical protein
MKIWDPKPPGTLWATPGLLRDSLQNQASHSVFAALDENIYSKKELHIAAVTTDA